MKFNKTSKLSKKNDRRISKSTVNEAATLSAYSEAQLMLR